ncbi:MAG: cytosolic protein [Lutibacter sp.]|nr:MAG: cytosolic protein [Lutibacter sp.]
MGIFKSLFKGNSEIKDSEKINWIPLTEMNQLETIVENSNNKTIAIFKHSTRCGISSVVLNKFERNYDISENDLQLYYLDLLKYRAISNEISKRFDIVHRSPQIIVFKHGKVIYHNSHYDISASSLKDI